MRDDKRKISIRYKDTGQVSRVPRFKAESLVDDGRAEFVSRSIWRAAKAGVKITPKMTDVQIKEAIRASQASKPKPKPEKSENGSKERKRDPRSDRGKNRKTRTR